MKIDTKPGTWMGIIILLLLITSCQTPDGGSPAGRPGASRHYRLAPGDGPILVLVDIGNEIHFVKWGTTIVQNNRWTHNTESWKVEEDIANIFRRLLSPAGLGVEFSVRKWIEFPQLQNFKSTKLARQAFDRKAGSPLRGLTNAKDIGELTQLAKAMGYPIVCLIAEGGNFVQGDMFTGMEQRFTGDPGFGLTYRSYMGFKSSYVHLTMVVVGLATDSGETLFARYYQQMQPVHMEEAPESFTAIPGHEHLRNFYTWAMSLGLEETLTPCLPADGSGG